MNLFKTVVRKFLWFDITPRKELYVELNSCYDKINNQNRELKELENKYDMLKEKNEVLRYTNSELKGEILDLQRENWDKDEHIHQLQEKLDELLGWDDCDDEEASL